MFLKINKVRLYFYILGWVSLTASADNFVSRYQVENEFNRKGYNLKGNVLSVKETEVQGEMKFGEEVISGEKLKSTIYFDSNGRLYKKTDPETTLYRWNGSNLIVISGADTLRIEYVFNNNNELIEQNIGRHEVVSKRKYKTIPGGYELTYYPEPYSKGEIFRFVNNKVPEKTTFGQATNTYNLEGEIINYTYILKNEPGRKDSKETKDYIYNSNGDLERIVEKSWINGLAKPPYVTVTKWVYDYDDHGNWITKRKYKKQGNEELKPASHSWAKREITYLSPEEIDSYYKNELTSRVNRRDSLIEARQKEIKKLYEDRLKEKIEQGIYLFADRNRPYYGSHVAEFRCQPINKASKYEDKYSFVFPDGTEVNNVYFKKIDDKQFFSPESGIVMVLQEFYDENENPSYAWYVGRIDDEYSGRLNNYLADKLETDPIVMELKEWDWETYDIGQFDVEKSYVSLAEFPSISIGTAYYIPVEYNAAIGFPSSMDENIKAKYQKELKVQEERLSKKRMIENAINFCQITAENKTGIAQKIKKLSENKASTSYNPSFDIELKSGNKYTNVTFLIYNEGAFFSQDNKLMLFNSTPFEEKGKSVIPFFIVELDINGEPCSANYVLQDALKNNILIKSFPVPARR